MTIPSGYSVPVPHSSPGGVPPPDPPGELVRHRVAVRTLVRLLTDPSVFFFFFLMGTQGGVHACGRLVLWTNLWLNHSLCCIKESKGQEQDRNEIEFLHFN